MFCPQCGKQNPEDAHFCESCGAKLDEAKEAKSKPTQTKISKPWTKKKKMIVIGSSVLAFVLVTSVISGCYIYRHQKAKSFDQEIKDRVEKSLTDGKELAEKFAALSKATEIKNLSSDVSNLKDQLKEDQDKISDLTAKDSKKQVIKDKAKDYFEKYQSYLESILKITEAESTTENTQTDQTTTSTTSTSAEATTTTIESLTEQFKEPLELADQLETAYADLRDSSEGILTQAFESQIKEIPTTLQTLKENDQLTAEQKAQAEALRKAAVEKAKQEALAKQRTQDLSDATTVMKKFDNALKNNDLTGYYDTSTAEFQSSADGQAIEQALQGSTMNLVSYVIKSSTRISDTKYRFTVREGFNSGGGTIYENQTYEVVKSGTRWLVDSLS